MKKILLDFFVFILILSFVFQQSSALATSNAGFNEPEPLALSDLPKSLDPEVHKTSDLSNIPEILLPPKSFLPENRYESEWPFVELRSDPHLPEDVRAHLIDRGEPAEVPEYTPPTPEVTALTQQQAESFSCVDVIDVPVIECEALVALYESTNGAGWYWNQYWLATGYVNSWFGVTVDNGHVSKIKLRQNNMIGIIPPELENLSHLEYLDLSSNSLTSIPPEFGNLGNLNHLELEGNDLTSIPPEFGNLLNLIVLCLGSNNLTSIPPELGNLSNLDYLTLDKNLLTSIPPELGNLANLTELWLHDTPLTSIPPELGNLGNLKALLLWGNQITSIPPELGNLSNLDYLDLSWNQLSSIPPELGNLSNLTGLNLAVNQLADVPPEFGNLVNLTRLELETNPLISIPPELGNLSNLEYLDLSWNSLTSIPPELENLVNLSRLYLSGSIQLTVIPPELGNLANLTELWLNATPLTSIPPELGNLSSLVYLNLSEDQITSIPPELGNLSNLASLDLSGNLLTSIPPELGNLGNLTQLNISSNQLTGIPPELGNLANLNALSMSDNQLTNLPSELGELTKLTWLVIASNPITGSIPMSFTKLTILDYFVFEDTNLCEPSNTEFLAWKATVSYWYGTGVICEIDDTPSWLLMFYMAGDNDLESDILSEVRLIIDSRQPNVDIAVLLDSSSQDTSYQFSQQGGAVEIVNKGNLNSGDGLTLSDFVLWAQAKSNAPRTALIIADHGHGLSGVACDYRANHDCLTLNNELRSALVTAGPVDVLYGHACLTASMEFMWQLRDLADYYVASESVSFTTSNDYILAISHETTAENLAISMANSYYSHWKNSSTASTVSVVNMAYIDEMFLATNALALAIHEASLAVKIDLWNLLDYTVLQRFHERERHEDDPKVIDNYDRLADLFHFASLANYFGDVSPAAQTLLDVENDFVIYNRAWTNNTWNHNNARGVSIALPLNPTSFYDGEWLDFATGADWSFAAPTVQSSIQEDGYNWGPMISELIEVNNPEGENDPLPPDPLPLLVNYDIFLPVLIR